MASASNSHAHVSTVGGIGIMRPLTVDEARDLTNRINQTGAALWRLMLESYERDAWRVLGYSSWREYAEAEFNVSHARAYQLMDQGRVIRALTEAVGSEDFSTTVENSVTERAAREIKPILPEAAEEIRERVAAGEPAAKVVPEVVKEARDISQAQRSEPAEQTPPDEPENDLAAELEAAVRENQQLQAQIESLTADDTAREIRKLHGQLAQLNANHQGTLRTLSEVRRQAEYTGTLLGKVRKTLSVERDRDIIAAIEKLRA